MNTDVKTHSVAFGWVGIIAVAAFCIMWLACYQADPSWTWGVNAISDFGISATDAADYFNYGCVIVGVLLAVYGVGRLHYNNNVGYSVGGIMLILAGICIAMVGIFTKDYQNGDYHTFFAVLGCIFMIAAVLAIAIQQYFCGMVLPVGVAIVMLLALILVEVTKCFELFEVYAIVAALIWVLMDAGLLIKSGLKGGKQ